MKQKSGQYQYKQITTTVKNVTLSNEPKIQRTINTVNTTQSQQRTNNTTGGYNPHFKGKINLSILKKMNVQWSICPKCGKMRYKIEGGKYVHGTGEELLEDITKIKKITKETKTVEKTRSTTVDKKYEKYNKYNKAAHAKCICGKEKQNCICDKKNRGLSVTTTGTKRSDFVKGKVDLTPKIKLTVDLNKFKKTKEQVEEEKKKREQEKTKRIEKKTYKSEEDIYISK